jgi:alkylation response protein AidB-like acyl-CoA dehydrogenase
MCMTEADAGSDLSRIRTRAVPDGAAWRISGEKIFISGGDQDLSEGILHLVLARTGDHGSGTRGLSLFLCRSHEEQGRRNSIRLVRIEEKLGLHASPTCQLSFEDATAEMIGQPGEGLKAMFVMMNHARIDVALQGVAHAARACDVASEFAARRVQGRHPGSALPVSIEAHGDVRRMLQEQGTLAVSGRALCYVALVELDVGQNPGLMDFLTPVCKFYCSEGGIRAANLGIQVLGGYGYLREYGMEQVLRDARITALYEGTNGIQATTLAGRLLRQNSGSAAAAFALWIADIIANSTGPVTLALAQVNRLWVEARNRVQASDDPGAQAHAFMQLTASLACLAAWQLILTQCESGAGYPAGLPELARQQFCNLPIEAQYWSATVSL